ncbi:MAG: efflux RND transporter permease subunit, partial [Gammaproteobacteria bacterium]|nr:efflux RND transporter permease subunit [Gammaproteobacteria bacterium]
MRGFAGVYDIRDDSSPGKVEFQFAIKESAKSLGLQVTDLAETVRNAYFGAEVMRLQRGRNEVKLMVRYPQEQRRSLADFREIRVRGADGIERPITEIADITVTRGYSEINRLDQLRSITISAAIDSALRTRRAYDLFEAEMVPGLLEEYPSLRFRWEGQQQETIESFGSLGIGFLLAMGLMYVLLV